jgi:hypothetical protein
MRVPVCAERAVVGESTGMKERAVDDESTDESEALL